MLNEAQKGKIMKLVHDRMCTDETKKSLGMRHGSKKQLIDVKKLRAVDAAGHIMNLELPDDELDYCQWRRDKADFVKQVLDLASFTDHATLTMEIRERCLDTQQRRQILEILEPPSRRSVE
jgi:hypothetical protein